VATIAGYATSSANSATAAATSATSAAASATAAATSATSAAASAASIVGDAAAAATSAASASTSAASAATSASSALTSANSADASATTAANSVATIAGYATSSANSATAAATSATSAAASATAAATSATSAATSASSALTSATSAATSYDDFDDRYLGAKASPPTVDNDGNALLTGALYWNTSVNKMYVWSGTAWGEISSSAEMIAYKYTVAGGATSVSGADDNGLTLTYTVGKEQVYINGVLQVRGSDYTASTGSSITGISAMIASDIVTVLAFTAFSISNTYTQAEADAKFFQTANAFVAGKNKIINGDFFINQRGFTSTTTSNTAVVDRFRILLTAAAGSVTTSVEQFTPGTAPVAGYEAKQYVRIITTGQAASTDRALFAYYGIEDVRTFAGQTVTLSFWAKAATGTPSIALDFAQSFGTGGSPSTAISGIGAAKTAITTSWARYSFTVAIPSISGKTIGTDQNTSALQFGLWVSAGSSFDSRTATLGVQNNTFDIWGVQIEAGSIATPFQTATGTIQGELAACQRYYYRWTTGGNANAYSHSIFVYIGTEAYGTFPLPTTMRVNPTVLDTTGTAADYRIFVGGSFYYPSVVPSLDNSNNGFPLIKYVVPSGLTAGQAGVAGANATNNTYIGFSAEL
jgi:hypothetical protein